MIYDGPGELVKLFDGPDYGPLWFDKYPIAIVVHTTETLGRPGYNGGSSAPQVTIDPAKQVVYQHQPLDRRGGALRGTKRVHTDTGVWSVMNEKAFHIEIIGYSDKAVVAKYGGGRRWVGDFDDSDYAFIADVTHYIKDLFGIGDALHALPAGDSWKAGISSPYRLSAHDWEQLDGMTAHGGIFGQTHWDTGVLDLNRLWTPRPIDKEEDMWDWITIDESLVRHAWAMGWLKPKTQKTLDYFLGLLPELQDPRSTNADVANFKRAVANGIARSAGLGGGADTSAVLAEIRRRLG